jgi:hypothetical protein
MTAQLLAKAIEGTCRDGHNYINNSASWTTAPGPKALELILWHFELREFETHMP